MNTKFKEILVYIENAEHVNENSKIITNSLSLNVSESVPYQSFL